MKVYFLIDSLGSGGAQNQLAILAVALKKRGYDVKVIVYFAIDFFRTRLDKEGVPVINIQKKDKVGVGTVRALKKILDSDKPAYLLSYLNTPNIYAALACRWSRSNTRHIMSYRSKSDPQEIGLLKMRLLRWSNKRADAIMFNSNHERTRWVEWQDELADKSEVIYNAVDLDRFQPDSSLKRNKKVLVVASPSEHKNGLVVIEAMKILKDQGCSVSLLWIGTRRVNTKNRLAYIATMESRIEEYNLEANWEWREPEVAIEKLYQKYHTLILASTTEGLPNVICESLACGLPVIASNVLDHPILIDHEKNGYLFDPESPKELAEVIQKMMGVERETYIEMSVNARAFASKNFEEEKFISQVESLIR